MARQGHWGFQQRWPTDIAFQNDDGTVAIWEMNGTNIFGGGAVANIQARRGTS